MGKPILLREDLSLPKAPFNGILERPLRLQWQKAGEQCCNATVIVINVGPLQSQVAGQRLERFCSSPANHDEQHRTDYQHDLYQRSPLL
jgi:hypothetical protein